MRFLLSQSPTAVEISRDTLKGYPRSLLILALGFVLGGAVGFIVGARWGSSTAPVSLLLFNSTSWPISSVRITHGHGVELVGEIPPSETRTASFVARGETSYWLSVSFADGTNLESDSRYAEPGYRVTERVEDQSIVPDFHIH